MPKSQTELYFFSAPNYNAINNIFPLNYAKSVILALKPYIWVIMPPELLFWVILPQFGPKTLNKNLNLIIKNKIIND